MPEVCRHDLDFHTGGVSPLRVAAEKREMRVPKAKLTILQNGGTPGSIVELCGRVGSVLACASSASAARLRDNPWRIEEKIRQHLT